MNRVIFVGALVLALAGCASDLTEGTKPNAYGVYDDISILECTGKVLNPVSECQLQQARENLGGPPMTWECKQILVAWQQGTYQERCANLQRP